MSLENIFLYPVACLFILFELVQKAETLNFNEVELGVIFKSQQTQAIIDFLLLSSRGVTVLCLTFRPMVHFKSQFL